MTRSGAHGATGPDVRRADKHDSAFGHAQVIHRFKPGFRWQGVELEPYKIGPHRGGEFRGASRQVLAGKHGERIGFQVRYFELEPGGHTSLERHRHCHVVIGVRGRGKVRVGGRRYTVGRFDALYIGPDQPHQVVTLGNGPFGFFCIVDGTRDRPRAVAT